VTAPRARAGVGDAAAGEGAAALDFGLGGARDAATGLFVAVGRVAAVGALRVGGAGYAGAADADRPLVARAVVGAAALDAGGLVSAPVAVGSVVAAVGVVSAGDAAEKLGVAVRRRALARTARTGVDDRRVAGVAGVHAPVGRGIGNALVGHAEPVHPFGTALRGAAASQGKQRRRKCDGEPNRHQNLPSRTSDAPCVDAD